MTWREARGRGGEHGELHRRAWQWRLHAQCGGRRFPVRWRQRPLEIAGCLPAPGFGAGAVMKAAAAAIRYQRVSRLTPQTLVPYVSLTFPALTPGSARWAALAGELLGVSASAGGAMVGLAIAVVAYLTLVPLLMLIYGSLQSGQPGEAADFTLKNYITLLGKWRLVMEFLNFIILEARTVA